MRRLKTLVPFVTGRLLILYMHAGITAIEEFGGSSVDNDSKRARDRILSLQRRAWEGDTKAWKELQDEEGKYAGYADHLVKSYGDIGVLAEEALIKAAVGEDLIAQEALKTTSRAMRVDLEGRDATPLERLLIHRIVCCWIQANHTTACFAQNEGRFTSKQENYQQRRQDKAHRRLLYAIKTLAQVRRLLGPSIQVNVAEKQVNVQASV